MKQIAREIQDHTNFQVSLLNLLSLPHVRVPRKQEPSRDLDLKASDEVAQPVTRRGKRTNQ